jgi:hypothetical protein
VQDRQLLKCELWLGMLIESAIVALWKVCLMLQITKG